jgi:hypothetical protein
MSARTRSALSAGSIFAFGRQRLLTAVPVVALAAAVGVLFAPAALASTGQGTPLTTQTQAMNGGMKVAQGSTLSAGYDFKMTGNHPLATVGFRGTTVTFAATCASGTPRSATIVVEPADQSYDDPANSSAWYPSGDQNNASTYQGSKTVPNFCDPGALVRLQQGGTFHTNVSSTDTRDKVTVRWHYKVGTGGGWSNSYTVIPSSASVCTVTNTRTNLIYSTLQGAQDAAGDGDKLTVQNTCTGTTTVSQDNLTIEGVDGTSPTLDGNQAGTVLSFESNLTFTVNNLTIQNGHGINGGGVAIHDGSTFVFNSVDVIDNVADRSGGGIYVDGTPPASTTSRLTQAFAASTTADGTSGTFYDVVVTENTAEVGGLGLDLVNAPVTLENSTITLNLPVRADEGEAAQVANYAQPAIEFYNIEGGLKFLHTEVSSVSLVGDTTYSADAYSSAFFVVVTSSWGATDVTCVTNVATGRDYATLQAAQDLAAPGDELHVDGTCHGQTIFTHNVRVTGTGVLDGGGSVTPVIVNDGVSMSIADMTITNGVGGGVQNSGTLDLLHTTVSGNAGGGILNFGGASMRIFDCSITGNTDTGIIGGGGIFNGGDFTAEDSDISNNGATFDGGGVWNGGNFTMTGATIDGNTAGNVGGGIYMAFGASVLLQEGSTITDNTATATGGGVYKASPGDASLTINDTSSITGNTPNNVFPF